MSVPPKANLNVVSSIASIKEEIPGDVDAGCGAFLSVSRLEDLERDPRYEPVYLVVRSDRQVLAILPCYCAEVPEWPDPSYQAALDKARLDLRSDKTFLVGGRADLVCGALLSSDATDSEIESIRLALRRGVAAEAGRRGRRPAAMFVPKRTLPLIAFATNGERAVSCGSAAWIDVAPTDRFLDSLKASHRAVVRRDWRAAEKERIWARQVSWDKAWSVGAPLVTNVLRRHGLPDDPRLTALRLEGWKRNSEIVPVAWVAEPGSEPALAVAFGWIWRDLLQMYEVGLADEPGARRHIAYVEAMIYGPLRYAQREGCSVLTLGLASTETKRMRGAALEDVFVVDGRLP